MSRNALGELRSVQLPPVGVGSHTDSHASLAMRQRDQAPSVRAPVRPKQHPAVRVGEDHWASQVQPSTTYRPLVTELKDGAYRRPANAITRG